MQWIGFFMHWHYFVPRYFFQISENWVHAYNNLLDLAETNRATADQSFGCREIHQNQNRLLLCTTNEVFPVLLYNICKCWFRKFISTLELCKLFFFVYIIIQNSGEKPDCIVNNFASMFGLIDQKFVRIFVFSAILERNLNWVYHIREIKRGWPMAHYEEGLL